jgi:hypothetical protein
VLEVGGGRQLGFEKSGEEGMQRSSVFEFESMVILGGMGWNLMGLFALRHYH